MSDVESDYEEETEKKTASKTKSAEKDNENDDNDDESASGSENSTVLASDEDDDDEDDLDEDMEDIDRIFEEEAGSKKKSAKKMESKTNNDNLLNSIFGAENGDDDDENDDAEFGDDEEGEYDEAYDEEEYGFKYLQKFDNETRKQIIDEYHREALQHSYEEIEAMCQIMRTQDGIIDPLHRTPPFLTKYEKARILGERAKQLGAGAKPFIELEDNMIDEYTIAVMEMKQGKLPFIIKRPLPNGGCEYWKLADLEVLQ